MEAHIISNIDFYTFLWLSIVFLGVLFVIGVIIVELKSGTNEYRIYRRNNGILNIQRYYFFKMFGITFVDRWTIEGYGDNHHGYFAYEFNSIREAEEAIRELKNN